MLLEIGLWESIENLDSGKFLYDDEGIPHSVENSNAVKTKDLLIEYANKKLGFRAGERYQQVVLKCLDGSFEAPKGNGSTGSELQLRFMKDVVDVLQDESEHV